MSTVLERHETEVEESTRPGTLSATRPAAPAVRPSFFADVLLEVDKAEKRRRSWAAVTSVILQVLIVGTLLIVPLMFTEALPKQQLLTLLVAPPPPPPPPPPAAAVPAQIMRRVESEVMDGRLRAPGRIPQKVQMIQEEVAPPQLSTVGGVVGGVPGGIPGGQLGGVIGGIISATSSIAAVPKLAAPARPERVRISQGVTRGQLIQKVDPPYPPIARAARIEGQVVLTAVISQKGEIENLALVSGHPMLVPAAVDAVRQWRYRPFLLNGSPVEVETTITITFQLTQ